MKPIDLIFISTILDNYRGVMVKYIVYHISFRSLLKLF